MIEAGKNTMACPGCGLPLDWERDNGRQYVCGRLERAGKVMMTGACDRGETDQMFSAPDLAEFPLAGPLLEELLKAFRWANELPAKEESE